MIFSIIENMSKVDTKLRNQYSSEIKAHFGEITGTVHVSLFCRSKNYEKIIVRNYLWYRYRCRIVLPKISQTSGWKGLSSQNHIQADGYPSVFTVHTVIGEGSTTSESCVEILLPCLYQMFYTAMDCCSAGVESLWDIFCKWDKNKKWLIHGILVVGWIFRVLSNVNKIVYYCRGKNQVDVKKWW